MSNKVFRMWLALAPVVLLAAAVALSCAEDENDIRYAVEHYAGTGVVVRDDRACPTIDLWREWAKATMRDDHGQAAQLLYRKCPRVLKGTVVVGPNEGLGFMEGGTRWVQYRGELLDGTSLWFDKHHVEWHRKPKSMSSRGSTGGPEPTATPRL